MVSRGSRFSNLKPEADGPSIQQETFSLFQRDRSETENIWAISDDNSDLEENSVDAARESTARNRQENYESSCRELPDLLEESEDDQDGNQGDHEVEMLEIDSSDDGYGEAEEEDEFYSTDSRSVERETDEKSGDESDDDYIDVLTGSVAEILQDRRATIEKLGELRKVSPDLQRKNRLLQYRVIGLMRKKQQTMTPELEASEDRYVRQLIRCVTTIDEIEARKNFVQVELSNLEESLKDILEEDSQVLGALVAREREIGAGLTLEKSGRVIGLKVVDAMIRRQILHRESMNRQRFSYIYLRQRHEDLRTKLRLVETLGEGMTIMDYEQLVMVNYSHRDKLEEREKELEKLYIKVQTLLNALNNYKEGHIANQAEIFRKSCRLEIARSETLNVRRECTKARYHLSRIRELCASRKRRGGMIFAVPVIHEMERTLRALNDLKIEIERTAQSYPKENGREARGSNGGKSARAAGKLRVDGARTTVTMMTKFRRSGMRSSPGRC